MSPSPSDRSNRYPDANDLPAFEHDGNSYVVPPVEEVHAGLVQSAVEEGEDICIVTPTLRCEYLDYHGLAALFADMVAAVLVMTPNADVRERYQRLENAFAGGMRFAESHWPLATVTANETLSRKTSLTINKRRSRSAPPKFIFCKHSNRLPQGADANRVDTIIYDDALKFECKRWERLQEWRAEHDVSTAVYFVRDPIGPVARRVKDELDTTWAWTPAAVGDALGFNNGIGSDNRPAADGGEVTVVPGATPREERLLERRARGVDYELQVQAEGPVVEAFSNAWNAVQDFDELVDKIGVPELTRIVSAARWTVAGHSRLLAKPKYSLKYRAGHHQATPHKTRIEKLDRAKHSLTGDAGAAFGPLDDLVDELEALRSTMEKADPAQWKRGSVFTAIKTVLDRNESLIVMVPDEAARKALQSDLLIDNSELWNRATPHVDLHTYQTLPQEEPVDHLLLFGPPKKSQRWLLRTPHAPHVTLLAYPHELGLLVSQTSHLNASLQDFTPLEVTDPEAVPTVGGGSNGDRDYTVLKRADPPSLIPDETLTSMEETSGDGATRGNGSFSLTMATPPYDGVSVEIPDEDEVAEFASGAATVITSQDGEGDGGGGLGDYQLVDTTSSESIDDLIDETASAYRDEHADATTGTGGSVGVNGTTGSGNGIYAGGVTQIPGLVEVRTEDGYANALEPTDRIEVVDVEAGTTVEKRATEVQSGEMVVVVHDRQAIREQVEDKLVEAGHFDLVTQARMWYERLDVEIERHDDDLDDFIHRLEDEGLDKLDVTYTNWYHGRVNMPRAKPSLRGIARAYEMDQVLENFDDVWDANQTIRNLKNDLIDELKNRVHETLTDGADDEFLDKDNDDLDVRLSDFPIKDDQGRPFVEQHVIQDVVTDVERPKSYVATWREYGDGK